MVSIVVVIFRGLYSLLQFSAGVWFVALAAGHVSGVVCRLPEILPVAARACCVLRRLVWRIRAKIRHGINAPPPRHVWQSEILTAYCLALSRVVVADLHGAMAIIRRAISRN